MRALKLQVIIARNYIDKYSTNWLSLHTTQQTIPTPKMLWNSDRVWNVLRGTHILVRDGTTESVMRSVVKVGLGFGEAIIQSIKGSLDRCSFFRFFRNANLLWKILRTQCSEKLENFLEFEEISLKLPLD